MEPKEKISMNWKKDNWNGKELLYSWDEHSENNDAQSGTLSWLALRHKNRESVKFVDTSFRYKAELSMPWVTYYYI